MIRTFKEIRITDSTSFTCAAILVVLMLADSDRAEARTWVYNGEELAYALKGEPAEHLASGKVRHRKLSAGRARSYISGVADATQGQKWCNHGNIQLNELVEQVSVYLDYLPATRLQENAAVLVEETLSKSFPCKPGMRK